MSRWWLAMGLLACDNKSTTGSGGDAANDAAEEADDDGFLDGGPPTDADADGSAGGDGGRVDADGSVDLDGTDTGADDDEEDDDGAPGDGGSTDGGSSDTGTTDDEAVDTGLAADGGAVDVDPPDEGTDDDGAVIDTGVVSEGIVVDHMIAYWDGVYRDGEPATATEMGSDGVVVTIEPIFVVELRSDLYDDETPDEYMCRVTYLQEGAVSVVDFSGHDAWEGYAGMNFSIDLGATGPLSMDGSCSGTEFRGESIESALADLDLGFGWGPMNDALMADMSDGGLSGFLGDTHGVAYLKWNTGSGGTTVAQWNFFQVTPFISDDLLDSSGLFVSGVSDGLVPADGHYEMGLLYGVRIDPYILTFTAD